MKPIFRLGSPPKTPPEIKYSGEVFTLKVNFKQIVKKCFDYIIVSME